MRKSLFAVSVAAGVLLALDVSGADLAPQCVAPEPPVIPAGDKATEAELIATQGEVKAYNAASDQYLTCLQSAEQALPPDYPAQSRKAMLELYNDTVDSMHKVTDSFNQAVRAYKAAQK